MGKKVDLTGQRFGRLLVIEEAGRNKRSDVLWKCKCDCGNEVTVCTSHLRTGNTKSCGCYRREELSEQAVRMTKHGLSGKYRRLYRTVCDHFRWIRTVECYKTWKIDPRYQNNRSGAAIFCKDLLTLYPKECARYENDKTLQLDKDNNSNRVFCPESVRFVTHLENINNRKNTSRLGNGIPLALFAKALGVKTFEDGKPTKEYGRYSAWFRKHDGDCHPELIRKANDLISLYSKCLKMITLLNDVRKLRETT